MNPVPQFPLVPHLGPPMNQAQPITNYPQQSVNQPLHAQQQASFPTYLQKYDLLNQSMGSRVALGYSQNNVNSVPYSNPDKERLDELTEQVNKLNMEVTYLRNQNSQLQAAQRNMESNYNRESQDSTQGHGIFFDRGQSSGQNFERAQMGGKGFERRQPPRQNMTWNKRPNNRGVPTPLDQPPNQEKTPSGVYLAEETLSGWWRLHKTNQHSELNCPEFQTTASIFQYEVEKNSNSQQLVPSNPYESSIMVLNHAPFQQSEENRPE